VRIEDPVSIGTGSNDDTNSITADTKIDLKGTMALAATIITFLAGITLLEGNGYGQKYQVVGLFIASGVSLTAFVVIEKRVYSPLLDFKLMRNKTFLIPTIILMLVSMSIFMVYLTIPIMVRSPPPFGFGGDAIAVAGVQLPFMIVLFIGTIMSGFILNRAKNTNLILFGTVISTMGFFVLLFYHSTEDMISVGLAILSAGLSLSITGAFNVILISVPMQMTGIALGMTLLLNLVGMSVGPALSGVFQEAYKGTAPGVSGNFPTDDAYNLIFVTATLVSITSVALALSVLKTRIKAESTSITGDKRERNKEQY